MSTVILATAWLAYLHDEGWTEVSFRVTDMAGANILVIEATHCGRDPIDRLFLFPQEEKEAVREFLEEIDFPCDQ